MDDRTKKKILIFACLGYLANGIITASLGPLLNQFAAHNQATLAEIGGVYTALFIGALLSNVALGRLTDRLGQHRALAVAFIIYAVAITASSFSRSLPLTFGLIFIAGLGFGTTNLCGNVLVGRVFKENSVSAVNWLNVFYGIGAFLGPLLVSLTLYLWKNGSPAIWFGSAAMAAVGIVMMAQIFKVHLENNEAAKPQQKIKVTGSLFLWSIGLITLIYVGTESTVGGWSTTYLQKTTTLPIELAAMATSAFWLALTGGRLMGAMLGSKISDFKLLVFCLAIASLGALAFLLGYGNGTLSILAILLMGLGFGAIYPTLMAMTTNAFRVAPGQAGGVVTAMGSVGGSLLPWLQGVILENLGMQAGTFFVGTAVLLLSITFAINRRIKRAN